MKYINKSSYINLDNASVACMKWNLQIAIVARPDWFIKEYDCKRVIIETPVGIHTHCFLGHWKDCAFLIIYGRFERIKRTSTDINFELTQSVINMLGIKRVIGTFVVGTIKKNASAGDVYLPDEMIGFGGYNQSLNKEKGFRNIDMFSPMCKQLHSILVNSSSKVNFKVIPKGTYVCFHHFPRIETKTELEFYERNSWDIVGQTLDPEATLARESGCHYACIAAAIDDVQIRTRLINNDPTSISEIEQYTINGRKKTFDLFLNAIEDIIRIDDSQCSCTEQGTNAKKPSKLFYYQPYFC